MKKNFNVKLTLSLVSLFIGIVFIILSKYKDWLLGLSFLFFALAALLFAFENAKRSEKLLKQCENDIIETNNLLNSLVDAKSPEALEQAKEVGAKLKYLHQQKNTYSTGRGRLKFSLIAVAVIFVLVGFFIFFS